MSYNYHIQPETEREKEFVKQARELNNQVKMPQSMLEEYIDETLHGLSDDEIALGDELKADMEAWKKEVKR